MQLNINTDASVIFTNTLEKLHRSALPSAIRGALNKAAFDVKTNTLQESAQKSFVKRQPNFFKANSRFEKATGFDVNSMKATVGMVSNNLKGTSNHAVKDLEAQEDGGSIQKKSFIPLGGARNSNNSLRNVRANARLGSIKNIVDARKAPGKTPGEKFAQSVAFAGAGGHVLANYKGKNILWKINSLKRTSDGNFKITALYSFKKGRAVSVQQTNFMRKAAQESAKKIEDYYIAEAMRQMKKFADIRQSRK